MDTPSNIPSTMRAVVLEGVTAADEARLTRVPVPQVRPGWVLVRVRGFGMNHSELLLREGEIDRPYIKKPIIPGIECVGVVADPSDTGLRIGQRVCALMGGMGRSFDGSYAEYALLPAARVFTVDVDLPWEELAAIPETGFTAWGSLFQGLALQGDDVLLVRGATCALGHAAVQIAHALGCHVIGTGRTRAKLRTLRALGCDEALVDSGELAPMLADREDMAPTKALELVGPATLLDTMRCVSPGGVVCCTGVLGGKGTLDRVDPITAIPNGVYLTSFYSNYPRQFDLDMVFDFFARGHVRPHVGRSYSFDDIGQACVDAAAHRVDGKIVVVM